MRERDLVGRDGLFVAEGRVVLEKAIGAAPERLVSILVAEPRLAGLGDLLGRLPEATPVYAASQPVMDAIVGFPIHRGILAVGRRSDRSAEALLAGLPAEALVVGLIGIANHDNMGGVFRNAAAFGADAVLLDETCCDPLYRKAIRVSVGATLTVPFGRVAGDLPAALSKAGFDTYALSPRGELDLTELAPGPRAAALFGAEGPGLPRMVMEQVRTVRIRMAQGFDSLNVSTTSGLVLHQIVASRAYRDP